ncbi:CPBP family intramembrane metalloprotease [Natrinema zhouii]|uniref:CPBP family intramembrane metalloprotease n=1 Tax=Natrinema zhouii TaxID=1710539 RepID=A0A7D6GJ74_9EURY|nr:type II CAAX endopeptidase family protein [Natrinema zhouii]QLK24860.1 CPBP family intramembrane metalloprotease [Natrinema zhouii]
MTETARADDAGPIASDVIPGIGTALAGITMVAMLVPVRQGIDDPVVWAGVGFALAAVLAFLVRRHAGLERTIAGPIAAASSVAVVLLAGYALNQGITASTPLPPISTSIPVVFVAFVTAGLTAGVGVAESVGIGLIGFKRRAQQVAVLTVVGFAGLFAPDVTTPILAIPVIPFVESLPETELLVISVIVGNLGMALGTAIIVAAYLHLTDRDRSFIDLRLPTAREVGWTVVGLIVLLIALFAIDFIMQLVGVEGSEHATTQRARERPELMLVMIPIAILIIGPFEELLYRNVIQKSLYETFSRAGAVVTGSVIFAAVHVSAYATAGLGAVIASLGTVFGLSLVLGTIYERTENLVIPALVHGLYNAVLFANLYSLYG